MDYDAAVAHDEEYRLHYFDEAFLIGF